MTQPPDMFPPDRLGMNYYGATQPYGSAPTMVKVTGILNLVMAGLDVVYGLCAGAAGALFLSGVVKDSPFNTPPGSGPPNAVVGGVALGLAVVAVLAGVVKLVAGVKLLRKRPGAWGWGLAAGIVGCTQLWCSYFCVLPMALGIFTIVAMCLENVRRYLADATSGRVGP